MTAADDAKAAITGFKLEVNTQISMLATVLAASRDTGEQILALRTHNLDLASAGGILTGTVREDIERLLKHYKLVHKILEDYEGML